VAQAHYQTVNYSPYFWGTAAKGSMLWRWLDNY
jgi:hypothetical protein